VRALLSLAVLAAGAVAAQPAKPVAARTLAAQPAKPVAARTEIVPAEPGSVKRTAMQALEKSIDGRIDSANPADPFDLLGYTRGVYVPGFGVVLSAEVDLIKVPGLSPFHPKITAEEAVKIQARKLQTLPKLREIMRTSLLAAAAELRSVPLNENIVFGVTLFYWYGEATAGLPGQIVMQATRQQLTTPQNPGSIKVLEVAKE
jgi:hypothetical protein